MENNLKKLEQTIGYQFTAKSLLEQAMTHSSYANEKHLGKLGCKVLLTVLNGCQNLITLKNLNPH